jgi:anti-anti-sigma regulatory factor
VIVIVEVPCGASGEEWLRESWEVDLEKDSASSGSNLVTRLNGKLSLETVHDFIQTLRPEPAAHLVLDRSGASFPDSA